MRFIEIDILGVYVAPAKTIAEHYDAGPAWLPDPHTGAARIGA
jgi:hypothetical protein